MKQNKYNSTITATVTRPHLYSTLSPLYTSGIQRNKEAHYRGHLAALACRRCSASRQKCYVHEPNWKSTQSGAEKRSLSLIPPRQGSGRGSRVAHLGEKGNKCWARATALLCLCTRWLLLSFLLRGRRDLCRRKWSPPRASPPPNPDACSRTLIMICATHYKQRSEGWSHNLAVYW
jgi:hypothetical protein